MTVSPSALGLTDLLKVDVRWQDLDHNGHLYHAVMLTLLDEARTRWLRDSIGVTAPDEYVVARVELDYIAEVGMRDTPLQVHVSAERAGTTSLTTEEHAFGSGGRHVATARVVIVMWDRGRTRPRPLTGEERAKAVANGQRTGVAGE